MIFGFAVKHNGKIYQPGEKVPVGQEPVKENKANDKSANEIRKELKEKYGVTKFPSNKKEDLVKMLLEAEKKAEEESNKPEDPEEENEGELEDPETQEGNEDPEGEGSLLDKILNEE